MSRATRLEEKRTAILSEARKVLIRHGTRVVGAAVVRLRARPRRRDPDEPLPPRRHPVPAAQRVTQPTPAYTDTPLGRLVAPLNPDGTRAQRAGGGRASRGDRGVSPDSSALQVVHPHGRMATDP